MNNAPETDNERPLLNTAEAIGRFGGDSDFYYEILEEYIKESQFDGQKTRDFLSAGKTTEAAREVHRFKGISGTAGAERLYDVCARAEAVLRGSRQGSAEGEIAAVERIYGLTRAEILAELKKKQK